MGKRIDSVVTAVLVVSALVISGSYAFRTFISPPQASGGIGAAPTEMREWDKAVAIGHTVAGDASSPATMLVFADLECPACRGFHLTTLKRLHAKYPTQLRVMYVSFPLSYHKYALPAARATECVARQGRTREWFDLIYEKQDSLGLKSIAEFAHDVGIVDTAVVAACASSSAPVERIDEAMRLAEVIKLKGTPTVVLNGWVFPNTPTESQVDSVMRELKVLPNVAASGTH